MPPGDQKHVRDTCRDDFLFSFLLWMFSGWKSSTLWEQVVAGNHPQAFRGRAVLCPVGPQWRWVDLVVHTSVVIMSLGSGVPEALLAMCDLSDFPNFPVPHFPSL